MKTIHKLLRVAPTFANFNGPMKPNVGYIASCNCGKKFEAGTRVKILAAYKEHEQEVSES